MWHPGKMGNQYPSLGQYSSPLHKERALDILEASMGGDKETNHWL